MIPACGHLRLAGAARDDGRHELGAGHFARPRRWRRRRRRPSEHRCPGRRRGSSPRPPRRPGPPRTCWPARGSGRPSAPARRRGLEVDHRDVGGGERRGDRAERRRWVVEQLQGPVDEVHVAGERQRDLAGVGGGRRRPARDGDVDRQEAGARPRRRAPRAAVDARRQGPGATIRPIRRDGPRRSGHDARRYVRCRAARLRRPARGAPTAAPSVGRAPPSRPGAAAPGPSCGRCPG